MIAYQSILYQSILYQSIPRKCNIVSEHCISVCYIRAFYIKAYCIRTYCISAYCIRTYQRLSGADFTKGLKPDFGLKFKTLVLNSGKNVHKGAKSMDLLSQWT